MARTTDYTKARLGIRARQDALQVLIKKHQEEFDKLVEDNRVRLGLSRKTASETPEQIKAKLERAEARAKKYKQMLAEVEADRKLTAKTR